VDARDFLTVLQVRQQDLLEANMVILKSLAKTPDQALKGIGWNWMLGSDTLPYITSDMVTVSEQEAEAYYRAGNDLYEMFVEAAQYVIDKNLFYELDIPQNLVDLIRFTWEDDSQFHLYGRFDFAGGIDGKPIKLIEFNADTATCIPETAVVQWAHLKSNQLDESAQFNTLYDSLLENFNRLKQLHPNKEPTMLFSPMKGSPEDDTNISVLMEAAREAGFDVEFRYIDEVEFSSVEGIFVEEDGRYYGFNFWFKLVPWEFIANEEPELLDILHGLIRRKQTIILNPPYTLLFQSKGIMKILWDLYPHHPLLLQTAFQPLHYKNYVEKVMFGREGANTKIVDTSGKILAQEEGEYGSYKKIYQEFADLPKDGQGNYYQAGVFFAYESCGLGFRRGGQILGNTAQFTGHIVK
jgi:glutathionylspermidine synthase